MNAQDTFLLLKDFFENRPIVGRALHPLQAGVEIGLSVANLQLTLIKIETNKIQLLQREPSAADVIFSFDALTAQRLVQFSSEDIGDWGVLIFREVLAGHISAQFPGSIWNLLSRGYIPIVLSGGQKVRQWLSENGFTDLTKMLRRLKRSEPS